MTKSNNKKTAPARGRATKKKLPRWVVVTAVVLVVLVAIGAVIASPFLTATASKDATLYLRRGTTNAQAADSLAACVSPEFAAKVIDLLGTCYVTDKHVISVQTDRGTPYNIYFQVQNELVAAYNELRDDLAIAKFGHPYARCSEDQQIAVRTYYPQKISEAEPKNYGGN